MNWIRLLIVKMIRFGLVKIGRGGSLPGTIALKLDKAILKKFKMPEHVILVTGTNGKTTTSNLIVESLKAAGLNVIGNRKGDNLREGITTLLCANSDFSYRIKADAVVLEVDELTIPRVFKDLHVSAFVVNNFFRDQLDRAGEMETIVRKVASVLPEYEGHLILNGDDPNVARLADHAPNACVHYYQVGKWEGCKVTTDEASEGKFCPRCGQELHYDYYQYSHIGRFICENDGFGQYQPDILVEDIDLTKGVFKVDGKAIPMFQKAIYAIYNCAAVLNVMKVLNLDESYAAHVFATYEMNDGRNETFMFDKGRCVLNLIKNPTGANEVMKAIVANPDERSVLIILNDNDQDGKDVSWIWDAHFELLLNQQTKQIICSGKRAYDMALRMKYQGFEEGLVVIEDIEEAVKELKKFRGDHFVVSTYTALQTTRTILRRNAA